MSVVPTGRLKKKFFLFKDVSVIKRLENPPFGTVSFSKNVCHLFHFLETQNLVTAAVGRAGGFQPGLRMGKEMGRRLWSLARRARVQSPQRTASWS